MPTSRYLSGCPDLDYFQLADGSGIDVIASSGDAGTMAGILCHAKRWPRATPCVVNSTYLLPGLPKGVSALVASIILLLDLAIGISNTLSPVWIRLRTRWPPIASKVSCGL